MDKGQVEWIRGSGWPSGFLVLTLGMAAFIAVGIFLFTGPRDVAILGLVPLFELVAQAELFWFALMVAMVWGLTPHAVGVSPTGVIYRALWYRVSCRWTDLGSPDRVSAGRVRFPVHSSVLVIPSATVAQARVIMTHPSCPKWPVSPFILQRLGFMPYRGPNGELVPLPP